MLKGKILFNGIIELQTPAIIGSGESESSDMDVLKDKRGIPYIPATSFAGILRHKFKKYFPSDKALEEFWGPDGEKSSKRQSSIIFSDLEALDNPVLVVRDGVKIDNKKGIAQEHAKFDYEVIERGSKFKVFFEINLSEDNLNLSKSVASTIVKLLKDGEIRIGAKTNSGFGRVELKEESVYEFDFSQKDHVIKWFKYLHKNELPEPAKITEPPLSLKGNKFMINAYFNIKNSLLVRDYSIEPDMPDVVHIHSLDKPVLPGTSLKGAVRARADRIVKTLGKPESIVNELFGFVAESSKLSKRGRIVVDETLIDGYTEEVQTRIKIDRFTGGTIEGALVESKPLFSNKNPKHIKLRFTINDYKDYEVGLMLLILKDLWTGDLPIGGEKSIGRGFLEGVKTEIQFDGKKIEFENPAKLKPEEREMLNRFVKALENHGGKK